MILQGPGKKWESYDLNKNGKPVRIPMHVKKGDTVVVITGRDKGKVGEVSQVGCYSQCSNIGIRAQDVCCCCPANNRAAQHARNALAGRR